MIEPVRQAAPPPPPPPVPPRPAPTITAAQRYTANWNPATTPPVPAAPPPRPAPEPQGFFSRLGTAISSGDIRGAATVVRSGIGEATEAGRNGVTSAVNWTGQTIGRGADAVRSAIPGDNILSNGLRGAVTHAEQSTRFSVGVVGGVAREAVSLVGTAGQLGTTLVEARLSPEARAELGQRIGTAVGDAATATGRYVSSAIDNPGRVVDDVRGAASAAGDFVGGTVDRYGRALAEGRTEEIGLDVGTVGSYFIPVGGAARAAVGLGGRAAAEGVARGGATLAAREGAGAVSAVVREAAPGVTRTAANDVARVAANDSGPLLRRAAGDGVTDAPRLAPTPQTVARDLPPADLHAQAQMAERVYGRGELPAGTRAVTDAGELARLNLEPRMLDRGAFHAEVYATGAAGSEAYTVAFRGSGGRLGDWVSNGGQGLGLPTNHYSRALEIGRAISRVDPSIEVNFVGHSLGGGLASHAANASGRHATTFNAAGLHPISEWQGRMVARQSDVLPGMADNYSVPGEFLTNFQRVPGIPDAFGTSHALPGIAPEGASFLSRYGPMAPINRHMMDWVLASTTPR